MSSKENLDRARKAKRDDFYTKYETVEAELPHYKKHFKNKTVLCNCNDGPESSFTRYFLDHFKELGLKRLVTTSYENALRGPREAFKYEYSGPDCLTRTRLSSGDYRAPECLELLDEADIVVTNPPFSKFRDFLDLLIEREKKFLILSNLNTLMTKKPFFYFMEGLWQFGVSIRGGGVDFIKPEEYVNEDHDSKEKNLANVRWLTNMSHGFLPPELKLEKTYDPSAYLVYDTYPAINVDKTKDIPKDYNGLMGVPITFLDKFNPNQFKLLGILSHDRDSKYDFAVPYINGKQRYRRLVIKRRSK